MKLIQDSREFIELLNSERVPFLVIGGWAYNRYAEPRFTGDIDLFLSADEDTEARLRKVLRAFGFHLLQNTRAAARDKDLLDVKVLEGQEPAEQ